MTVCMLFPEYRSLFLRILQQIARLTMQRLTNGDQGREADRADMSVFELGQVDVGNADLLAQLVQADLAIRHHAVESYNDLSHTLTLHRFVMLFLELCSVLEDHCQHEDDKDKSDRDKVDIKAEIMAEYRAERRFHHHDDRRTGD